MGRLPKWFTQLKWSKAVSVDRLNVNRKVIPTGNGIYVFTSDDGPLTQRTVLYVGETGQKGGLHGRLSGYLADYTRPKARESHKARGFILEYRSQHGDHRTYVRWAEYGGSRADRLTLEASLIHFLNPPMNDREEDARHPLLGDREALDPRLLG